MRAAAAVIVLGALGGAAPPAGAQSLEDRVRAAPEGWVRFAFEAREGLCGDGERAWTSTPSGERPCACDEGPLRVDLRSREGRVERLEVHVGGEPAERAGPLADLGTVAPAEAAAFLLDLAGRAPPRVGERAIFAAFHARGVETWPRLLEIARDGSVPREARRGAIFWLGQATSERAVEGLESVIRDEEELAVREHAVFALSRHRSDRALVALIRLGRSSPEPAVRKKALFWLAQRHDDERVLALFEEILSGGP